MTNNLRRAYGIKATYRHDSGLVVLYGDQEHPAEVREELVTGSRVLKGRKIRFWTRDEQIEVLDADISAPAKGLKPAAGFKL